MLNSVLWEIWPKKNNTRTNVNLQCEMWPQVCHTKQALLRLLAKVWKSNFIAHNEKLIDLKDSKHPTESWVRRYWKCFLATTRMPFIWYCTWSIYVSILLLWLIDFWYQISFKFLRQVINRIQYRVFSESYLSTN